MSRVPPTFDFQDFSVPSPSAETKDVSIVIVENPFDKAGISATTSNEEHDEAAADISDVMEAIGEVRRRLSSASANEISLNDDSTANQVEQILFFSVPSRVFSMQSFKDKKLFRNETNDLFI